jgi:drug/metabolite transporter (DMT)-like permease
MGARRAVGLTLALVGLIYLGWEIAIDNPSPPGDLAVQAFALLSVGLVFAAVSWGLETSARNRLSRLCRRYE